MPPDPVHGVAGLDEFEPKGGPRAGRQTVTQATFRRRSWDPVQGSLFLSAQDQLSLRVGWRRDEQFALALVSVGIEVERPLGCLSG